MRLGNMEIPCGCSERKSIIFESGNLGVAEGAIITAAALILLTVIIARKGKISE